LRQFVVVHNDHPHPLALRLEWGCEPEADRMAARWQLPKSVCGIEEFIAA
jgi:hypothetical protein